MKILYVTSSFPSPESPTNGIFNYHRVKELLNKNIHVKVVTFNSVLRKYLKIKFSKDYNLNELGYNLDLDVTVINGLLYPKGNIYLGFTKKLKDLFNKGNFDLIHCHFIWDGFPVYLLSRKYGIPYVITAHGSDIHTYPFRYHRMKPAALLVLNNAKKVIFVSGFLLVKSRELGFQGTNVTIIPNGIDPEIFNCKTLPLQSSNKIIGYIGKLNHMKGADRLPKIFHEVSSQRKNVLFNIIGGGELKHQIALEISSLGFSDRVFFYETMPSSSVAAHMKKMDALVLPSRNEGWPCVVLESIACGTPVIGSNNGGIPEAIANNGIVVPEGDNFEKRMAHAIIEIIDSPVSRDTITYYPLSYTWDRVVSQEVAIYKEAIDLISH